jgi:hypothetical protein
MPVHSKYIVDMVPTKDDPALSVDILAPLSHLPSLLTRAPSTQTFTLSGFLIIVNLALVFDRLGCCYRKNV